MKKYTFSNGLILDKLKFILPSLLGVFLFLTPISQEGGITIPVAILSNALVSFLTPILPYILFSVITITFVGTLIGTYVKPQFITKHHFLNNLFNVTPIWMVLRALAFVFVAMSSFQIGPEFVWSDATGGMILEGLLPTLFSVFLFAGLFLPLLLNFGLLEFIGSLLIKLMGPVFKLPGRSEIDCIASWLGDGTVGVLLTSKQYEEGFYTEREASVIGTNFSLVSITFTLIIIAEVGLSHLFIPFYLTVTLASIVAAIIVPKFGPLAKKKDRLIDGSEKVNTEDLPQGYTSLSYGFEKAVERAHNQNLFKVLVVNGFQNVVDMWFAVIPMVMAIGTLATIIAEKTPLFSWLGIPFIPVLTLLGIPEAAAAASTLLAGFADMLLPSIMAVSAGIESELTLFVVASVSVTQLIYLSEVGAVLLASKIPVSFKELFIIFIQRTLITLPIIAGIGHLLCMLGFLQ